jgi:hypothetical protein
MIFNTIVALSALLATAAAAPAQLSRRNDWGGTSQYAPAALKISSNQPTTPVTTGGLDVFLSRTDATTSTDTLLVFEGVPVGATQCSLILDYAPYGGSFASYSGDAEQINAFSVGPVPPFPDWDQVDAATGSLVGTFEFPGADSLGAASQVFINTFVCEPTMSFRLSINENAKGWVSEANTGKSGFKLQYNLPGQW